jgi:hypothetical protein
MNSTTDNVIEGNKQPTKAQLLVNYMFETLKEMFSSLAQLEFNFAVSGIIIALILLLISSFFFLGSLLVEIDLFPLNYIGFIASFFIAFLEIYLWFLVGTKVTPKAAHYLVDNKVLKLLFTKGNVHYLEYVPEEKRKIALPHILNKYIALIIAWVSLSAFFLQLIAGFITGGDPRPIVNSANPDHTIVLFIIRTLVVFVLVPLIFTLVYPVGWMLIDAKLKAYNSVTQLNWLVGKKVVNLTSGIITIGSIVGLGANLLINTVEQIIERAQLIFDLVLFCLINVSLTVTLIAIFYSIFFQGAFYRKICESIEIGFGVTSVTLVDKNGTTIDKETTIEEPLLVEQEIEKIASTPTEPEAIADTEESSTQLIDEETEKSEPFTESSKEE